MSRETGPLIKLPCSCALAFEANGNDFLDAHHSEPLRRGFGDCFGPKPAAAAVQPAPVPARILTAKKVLIYDECGQGLA